MDEQKNTLLAEKKRSLGQCGQRRLEIIRLSNCTQKGIPVMVSDDSNERVGERSYDNAVLENMEGEQRDSSPIKVFELQQQHLNSSGYISGYNKAVVTLNSDQNELGDYTLLKIGLLAYKEEHPEIGYLFRLKWDAGLNKYVSIPNLMRLFEELQSSATYSREYYVCIGADCHYVDRSCTTTTIFRDYVGDFVALEAQEIKCFFDTGEQLGKLIIEDPVALSYDLFQYTANSRFELASGEQSARHGEYINFEISNSEGNTLYMSMGWVEDESPSYRFGSDNNMISNRDHYRRIQDLIIASEDGEHFSVCFGGGES